MKAFKNTEMIQLAGEGLNSEENNPENVDTKDTLPVLYKYWINIDITVCLFMLISSFWAIEYNFQRTMYDLRCATVSLNLKAFLS